MRLIEMYSFINFNFCVYEKYFCANVFSAFSGVRKQ